VARDAAPGFVASRAREAKGRPVAFAFEAPPAADGSEIFLDSSLLEAILNFRSAAGGHAYPPFFLVLRYRFLDGGASGAHNVRYMC
jgi:hypothetical protein